MKNRDPKKIAFLIAGLVLVAIGVRYAISLQDAPAPTGKTIYYGGPMMNKSRTGYADDKGNIVPPPPGAPQPNGTNPTAPGTPAGAEGSAPKSIDNNNRTPAAAGASTD